MKRKERVLNRKVLLYENNYKDKYSERAIISVKIRIISVFHLKK